MRPRPLQQAGVVINNHDDLARRYSLPPDRLHRGNEIVPAFFCIRANYNGNIQSRACHRANSLPCGYRVTRAELRRTICHAEVRARTYIVDTTRGLRMPSNPANASTLVPALTVRRPKAKGSLVCELISCLTAQAEVYPASRTCRRTAAVW